MPTTIREQIIAAFAARAASLSALPVERAKRSLDETEERFISIWDGPEQDQAPLYGQQPVNFDIALECIWPHGFDNPSVSANALLGDIIVTLIGPATDRTFGGLATNIVKTAASPGYPQDGGAYTTLTVIFTVSYATATGDPYTVGEL